MASSDLRDVLNLPDGHAGARPSKKQKLAAPRPNLKGLAREVQNLGGDNPIALVPQATPFKKRRLGSRKPAARWEARAFRNSGRDDTTLILRHWRRIEASANAPAAAQGDGAETQRGEGEDAKPPKENELEDSAFAKFNVHVNVPQYSPEYYQQSLQNSDWTKEETDYLMETVREFDLRWPLIWDRYDWNPPATNGEADADGDESKAVVPATRSRSMEDLKARYYEVAAKMMALTRNVHHMSPQEFSLHELMTHFNPAQEKARKDFAINSLNRSPEDAREEESLLLEIKRILARSDRFNEDRRGLYQRLDYPHSEADIGPFRSSAGLQSLLQNLMTVDKTKKRRSLMGSDGVTPSGQPASQAAAAQEAGRRESTAASTGHRDSIGGAAATPTGSSKKGQQPPAQQPERRKLTEREEAIYGVAHFERLGSGPAFRTEKINKLFSHKSNQQQIRINNTLNELDVPAKLAMPTAATTHAYEMLLGAVNSLLDARKVTDKLDGEIKIEEAKKAEREKALAPPESEAAQGEKDDGAATDERSANDESKVTNGEAAGEKEANANAEGDEKDVSADTPEKPAEAAPAEAAAEAEAAPTEGKSSRPSSRSANHKRSASVLSSVSDRSTKRQKK